MTELSALQHIAPMQRRRLSGLAKLAIHTALQTKNNDAIDYIVWVSQYGDEQKTLQILQDVLQGQVPSPTQFSTSVHNAIAGLYSILCQDDTVSTSLSGCWADGLLEAYAYLKNQSHAKVLVVYYDAPLPEIYADMQCFETVAMAGVVSLDQPNLQLDFLAQNMSTNPADSIQDFLRFWQTQQVISNSGMWQKCG
ncbi:MAG: beta-ketoacyl synthase chain length factor [Acinetobacter sp.]